MPFLGARFFPDQRDQNYRLSALHSTTGIDELPLPRSKSWRTGKQLDQGQTSACVGYALQGLLEASPIRQYGLGGHDIYHEAQRNDEWPGEDYEGTSVRAGLKVVRAAGFIESYYWAQGWGDLKRHLALVGPAVFASTWLESMSNPHPTTGRIQVITGSRDLGGHALLAVGYSGSWLHLENSWGFWGQRGGCWLSKSDFELLQRVYHVEVAAVVERVA